MRIVVIGTGYVGLVTGTCLADSGNQVTCVDVDASKVAALRAGKIPIYEPGLEELVAQNVRANRLGFTTSAAEVVPHAEIVFIAVGTPQSADGAANLQALWRVAEDLAPHLATEVVVVVKSTVPVGTNRKVAQRLAELTGRKVHVASNPEFLKEGCAIEDFTSPDRVVVGVDSPRVGELLHALYRPFLTGNKPFLQMDLESAEMTKYVANCLLATKISFINEMANLCERAGANINSVRQGIGHDARIGFAFLAPGVGYGGSCFPKDVRALIHAAEQQGLPSLLMRAVDAVNSAQKQVLFEKLSTHFAGVVTGRTIAIWGLAFKPRTDDIRDAPAIELIERLLAAGAKVQVHDPIAMVNVRAIYGDRLTYCEDQYEALNNADALAIVTDWNEFRSPDFERIRNRLRALVVMDGRNLYDPTTMAQLGFQYAGIGLSTPSG